MYRNEIAFENHETGMEVAKSLLTEGYVVMLSYEEHLLIVNFEWCPDRYPDRNHVVFMSCDEFEENYVQLNKEEKGE